MSKAIIPSLAKEFLKTYGAKQRIRSGHNTNGRFAHFGPIAVLERNVIAISEIALKAKSAVAVAVLRSTIKSGNANE